MELQVLLILIIAFIFLGPEGMLNVATKLGELARQARELIDQLKMEAYMEEFNRKILEEEKRMKGEEVPPEDISEELKEELEDALEEEEEKEKDDTGKTSGNASDGTSERA